MDVKAQVIDELHKPARKNYKRRRTLVRGLNDLLQADLVEMIPYAKSNRGFKYILIVINVFSKKVSAYPVKTKTAKDVTKTMRKILLEYKKTPKNLQTDQGKEFFNKEFNGLMKEFNINHYHTYSTMKASVVERVNRTLKNIMWKRFSLQGNYKWLQILPQIINKYNNTKHTTTGMKPSEITQKHEKDLMSRIYTHPKIFNLVGLKFNVGNAVRISKYREAFHKAYKPSWSNEIFRIKKINVTSPETYTLEDQQNNEIKGAFYKEELQKVKHPDVYLVEKILKRSGNRVFVKWLGLPTSQNSWIANRNLLK